MVNTIGSPASPTIISGSQSTAALEGQLARYQVQLADWVNCPSCKTPEGKAKIAEISDKVRGIEQRLRATENAPQVNRPNRTVAASINAQTSQAAPTSASTESSPAGNISVTSHPSTSGLGNFVDVFV